MTGRWFSLGPPVSSTNKTDHHDITEILLKVALNIKNLNQYFEWITINIIRTSSLQWPERKTFKKNIIHVDDRWLGIHIGFWWILILFITSLLKDWCRLSNIILNKNPNKCHLYQVWSNLVVLFQILIDIDIWLFCIIVQIKCKK